MRTTARIKVCSKHDELYHTIKNVGYEYDADLWGECPLCWLFGLDGGADHMVAEKFSLHVEPGDLVEIWSAQPPFAVAMKNALASIDKKASPPDYDGPKYAGDAIVESHFLTPGLLPPGQTQFQLDPNWEYLIIRISGGRFLCDRVPWGLGRMEFSGPHPEDEEWSMRNIPLDAPLEADGLPPSNLVLSADVCNIVRIYKKEMTKQ